MIKKTSSMEYNKSSQMRYW